MPKSEIALTPANMRVHVVHYTPFTQRRTHMDSLLQAHGLDLFPVSWMLDHDREALLNEWALGQWGDPAKMPAASVSLILKHLEIYKQVSREPDTWHLILEDDVLISASPLIPRMERCLAELPEDWELLFIGEGCNLHVPWWRRRPGKEVYFRGWKPWWRAGGGTSRCTEAYFIHPAFATRLLETRFARPPFHCPIDWLLAEAGYEMQIRSYWAEPPLITQGAFESWTKDTHLNTLLKPREIDRPEQ